MYTFPNHYYFDQKQNNNFKIKQSLILLGNNGMYFKKPKNYRTSLKYKNKQNNWHWLLKVTR